MVLSEVPPGYTDAHLISHYNYALIIIILTPLCIIEVKVSTKSLREVCYSITQYCSREL